MAAIGHYDFGENLKPINFDQWLSKSEYQQCYEDKQSMEFWLSYWVESYQYLLNNASQNSYFISLSLLYYYLIIVEESK